MPHQNSNPDIYGGIVAGESKKCLETLKVVGII